MHHEACRLVDDDEVIILIDHGERDFLAPRDGVHRFRADQADDITN
jgi:hypothetical protein